MQVLAISGSEATAWMAALTAGVAILAQAYNALKKRKQERTEMTVALDRQPQIRQQLELGNVGEAVKHLNVIINSQAQHIQAQDGQLQHCNSEIERLNGRNSALEAEAEGWENKYRNLEESVNRRIEEVEAKYESRIKEMERSYARSLLMLKEKGNNS